MLKDLDLSDSELLLNAINDKSYLSDLSNRYHQPLTKFVTRYVRDKETSEDIVQETFLRCMRYSYKYPDIKNINRFIQNLKDMRAYEDMLDEFIFGDQKTYPDDKRPVGSKDVMTLDEIMNDLQLRFMDERDKNNGKD